jgi:hypothetical protein
MKAPWINTIGSPLPDTSYSKSRSSLTAARFKSLSSLARLISGAARAANGDAPACYMRSQAHGPACERLLCPFMHRQDPMSRGTPCGSRSRCCGLRCRLRTLPPEQRECRRVAGSTATSGRYSHAALHDPFHRWPAAETTAMPGSMMFGNAHGHRLGIFLNSQKESMLVRFVGCGNAMRCAYERNRKLAHTALPAHTSVVQAVCITRAGSG